MPKNKKEDTGKPKVRVVRIPEGTPMPRSAEDLARAPRKLPREMCHRPTHPCLQSESGPTSIA